MEPTKDRYDVVRDAVQVFEPFHKKFEDPMRAVEVRAFFMARAYWKGYAAAYDTEGLLTDEDFNEQALTNWRDFLPLAYDIELAILQTQRGQSNANP